MFRIDKSDNIFIWILIIVTMAILAISFLVLPEYPVSSDSLKYDEIAKGIIDKGQYLQIEDVTYAPGYPLFLSSLYLISGYSVQFVYLIQFILLGAIGILTFLISKKILGMKSWLAFLSGLFLILWPYFILYSKLIMTEILFSFIFVLFIFLHLNNKEVGGHKNAIVPGVLLGIGTLIRPAIILLPFWLLAISLVSNRKSLNKKYWGKLMITFLIVIAPWTIFVSVRHNALVPIASNFTPVLEKSFVNLSYEEGFSEDDNADAVSIIKSKMKNLFLFWNPGASGYQVEALKQKLPGSEVLINTYKFGFFLILLAAVLSVRFYKNPNILFLLSVIIYFWAIHSALFPYPRYTLPIMPLVVVLALYSVNRYIGHKHKYDKENTPINSGQERREDDIWSN